MEKLRRIYANGRAQTGVFVVPRNQTSDQVVQRIASLGSPTQASITTAGTQSEGGMQVSSLLRLLSQVVVRAIA